MHEYAIFGLFLHRSGVFEPTGCQPPAIAVKERVIREFRDGLVGQCTEDPDEMTYEDWSGVFIVPYVVQRTRNNWCGIMLHAALN